MRDLPYLRDRIWDFKAKWELDSESKIGSLSNNEGEGYQNITEKESRCLKLYRAYSISFNSSNVGKVFWSWILKDCIKVQEKERKVVVLCYRPGQNVNLGTFTL